MFKVSTLLSTGDRNVQGHGLYTVLLPLLNSFIYPGMLYAYLLQALGPPTRC